MSIKRVDPSITFDVIHNSDSAIIHETDEELAAAGETYVTRYDQYSETLDQSKLLLKPDEKPTIFRIRCLKNAEMAEIQQKYVQIDTVNKTAKASNSIKMMLEYFDVGCLGILNENGAVEKVSSDEVGFGVAAGIGAQISLMTSLGKNLKKK